MTQTTFEKKDLLDGKILNFIDDSKAFENLSFNRRYTQENRDRFAQLSKKYSNIANELMELRFTWK